jgi:hypothetical protein
MVRMLPLFFLFFLTGSSGREGEGSAAEKAKRSLPDRAQEAAPEKVAEKPEEKAQGKDSELPARERAPFAESEPDGDEPAADKVDQDVQEIEKELWREVDSVEKRLRSIKERMQALLPGARLESRSPGLSEPQGPEELFGPKWGDLSPKRAKSPPIALIADEDARRYVALLKRQAEIEKRWRELVKTKRLSPAPGRVAKAALLEKEKGGKVPPEPGKEEVREALRSELRQVLSEILAAREKAREREVERLRLELEGVERVLKARSDPEERRKMVESRLEEVEKTINEKKP